MALIPTLLPLLRPIAPSRPRTFRRLHRFSSAARCRTETNSTSTLLKTIQAPQNSAPAFRHKHQRWTGRPRIASSSTPKRQADPTAAVNRADPEIKCIPPLESLPYHVQRIMPSRKLPIYTDSKGHGTLKLTVVRKIIGDRSKLASDLREYLGIIEDKDCKVNSITGHVVVKGLWVSEINRFLNAKGF